MVERIWRKFFLFDSCENQVVERVSLKERPRTLQQYIGSKGKNKVSTFLKVNALVSEAQ